MRIFVHLPQSFQNENEENGEQHVEINLSLFAEHGEESGPEQSLPSHGTGQREDQQQDDGDLRVEESRDKGPNKTHFYCDLTITWF